MRVVFHLFLLIEAEYAIVPGSCTGCAGAPLESGSGLLDATFRFVIEGKVVNWAQCFEAEFFKSSATVFSISRESASSDTARARDIAPTSALKVKIALDLAVRLSLAGRKAAIN